MRREQRPDRRRFVAWRARATRATTLPWHAITAWRVAASCGERRHVSCLPHGAAVSTGGLLRGLEGVQRHAGTRYFRLDPNDYAPKMLRVASRRPFRLGRTTRGQVRARSVVRFVAGCKLSRCLRMCVLGEVKCHAALGDAPCARERARRSSIVVETVYTLRGLALERPLFCFCAFLDGFFRFYLLCWCCRLPVTAQSKRRINRINASNELVRQVSPNLQGMLSSETRVCKLTHCFEAS